MIKCNRTLWGYPCGGAQREVVDTLGRVGFVCDGCARYDAGICRDCPSPRENRSRRCALHRAAHRKAQSPKWSARNREAYLARKRERYRTDPEYRQRCLADVKRRDARPRTDIDRAYDRERKRRSRARQRDARPSRAA